MVPAPLHGRAPHWPGGGRPGQGHTVEEALALRRKDPSRQRKNGKSHKRKNVFGCIVLSFRSFALNRDDFIIFCRFEFRLEPLLLSYLVVVSSGHLVGTNVLYMKKITEFREILPSCDTEFRAIPRNFRQFHFALNAENTEVERHREIGVDGIPWTSFLVRKGSGTVFRNRLLIAYAFRTLVNRGSQRDVVYLGWLTSSSFLYWYELNCGGWGQGCGSAFIWSGSGSSILLIRIQHVADPDPIQIQGFKDQNYKFTAGKKKIFLIKNYHLPILGLFKERPSYRRSLQPSKENIQHFKTWNF